MASSRRRMSARRSSRLPSRELLGELVVDSGDFGRLTSWTVTLKCAVFPASSARNSPRGNALRRPSFRRRHADDARGEAGNEALFDDLGHLVLGGAALEGDAVDRALVVQGRRRRRAGRPLDRHQRSALLAQRFEAAVDVALGRPRRARASRPGLCTPQLDRRADPDRRPQAHGRPPLPPAAIPSWALDRLRSFSRWPWYRPRDDARRWPARRSFPRRRRSKTFRGALPGRNPGMRDVLGRVDGTRARGRRPVPRARSRFRVRLASDRGA